MYEAGFYRRIALNSPYMDFLKAHVADIFDCLPAVDGLFFDIVHAADDSSVWTTRAMLEAGLDPGDPAERLRYGGVVLDDFRSEMSAYVRQFSDDCTIFYNRGHVGPHNRRNMGAFTHWELESLPSGHWGYIHFPLTIRYARTLGHALGRAHRQISHRLGRFSLLQESGSAGIRVLPHDGDGGGSLRRRSTAARRPD